MLCRHVAAWVSWMLSCHPQTRAKMWSSVLHTGMAFRVSSPPSLAKEMGQLCRCGSFLM